MKFWAALLVLLCGTTAWGQGVASLRGHVTDASGAAISGAGVKLVSATTDAVRDTVTDGNGAYEFLQLQPGKYSLEVAGGDRVND